MVWLKVYNYFKNLVEENISQEFRLKNINETRNYFIEEINQNELMTKKHKSYFEHLLILVSTVTGCVSFLPLLV